VNSADFNQWLERHIYAWDDDTIHQQLEQATRERDAMQVRMRILRNELFRRGMDRLRANLGIGAKP
jgi:hypothetical protein